MNDITKYYWCKIVALILFFTLTAFNANAGIRCQGKLFDEGDSATKMITICGSPNRDDGAYIEYTNLNGWHYLIHIGGGGAIDSIVQNPAWSNE